MFIRMSIAAALALLALSPAHAQPGFTTYLIAFMTQAAGQTKAGGSCRSYGRRMPHTSLPCGRRVCWSPPVPSTTKAT